MAQNNLIVNWGKYFFKSNEKKIKQILVSTMVWNCATMITLYFYSTNGNARELM